MPNPALFLTCFLWVPALFAQEDLKDRNYYIRIGVARQVTALAVKPTGAYYVSNPAGLNIGNLTSGASYRIVVREMDVHQEENAKVLTKAAASAYELPTKLVRMPPKEEGEDERLLITVGEFNSMQEARDYQSKLKSDTIRFVYEEPVPAREGRIIIRNSAGGFVAADPQLLRITPVSHTQCSIYVNSPDEKGKLSERDFAKSRHYRGLLDLAIDEKGTLTCVNNLWLEYYLYGVVATEMGPTAPYEALKAQAIVARSTAVARIEKGIVNDNPLFDFVDTQMDQAYKGKGNDSSLVKRAVDETKGEVLVWDGKPVEAVYSHSCGGVISSAADMWDSTHLKYFQRKPDSLTAGSITTLSSDVAAADWIRESHDGFCNPRQEGFPEFAKKNYHWTETRSGAELSKALDKAYGTGKIKDIRVEKRSGSGRVRILSISGDKKRVRLDREMVIRSALIGLKSTFFVLDVDYDESRHVEQVVIHGAGYGHGVGMCQIGAIMMAKRGYDDRHILGHYFTDVKIRKLYK